MKNKLLLLLSFSAFLAVGCGDDGSSTSAPTPEETTLSSSSKTDIKYSSSTKEASSSSQEQSSSSEASSSSDEYSSSSKKKGSSSKTSSSSTSEAKYPAATLKDLEKNVELKLFDQTVYLSTGSKQGLVALRIPNELWIITYTDFAGGVIKFEESTAGVQYSETDAAKKIIEKLKAGFKISFVIDKNETVLYRVNNSGEFSEAVKASVAIQEGTVSNADAIKDKTYECTDDKTTRIFKFFDSSYIVENLTDGNVTNWHAGRYDIQRSTLLILPQYYAKSTNTMFSYSMKTDNTISATDGGTMECTVQDNEYPYEKAADYVGKWVATNSGIKWTFTIKTDGTYNLEALEGSSEAENKKGVWEIYGYYMVMRNQACLSTDCTPGIYGQLQPGPIDLKTGKISGFSFIHHDTDSPKIPVSFDAP